MTMARQEVVERVVSWDELAEMGVPQEVLAVRDEIEFLPSPFRTDLLLVYVQLRGVTPLLQHRPALRAVKKQRGEQYDPHKEAERAAYRHPTHGWLYVKSDVIRALLRDYGLSFIKRKVADALLRCVDGVRPLEIPIIDPYTGDYVRTYEIQEYSGVLNPRVGRVVQWRPLIRHWQLDFILLLNTYYLETSDLLSLLYDGFQKGGRTIGIGDWRPLIVKSGKVTHTGGEFGKFLLTAFCPIKWEEG